MPQTVEIPDHGIAEFPDDMTPDEIKGVIQKKFYSQPSPTPEPTTASTAEVPPTTIPISGMQTESREARQFTETPESRAAGELRGTGDQPVIPIPRIPQQQGVLAQLGAGTVNAASQVAEMVETPMTLAALPVAPLRLTQILFGGQALSDIKTAYEEAAQPETTIQRGIELGGRAVADALFGVSLVKGATAPRPTLTETITGEKPPLVESVNEGLSQLEKEQNASQITSTESVTQPEVRTPVGEETPLRQQGETTEARQGIEAGTETAQVEPSPEIPQLPGMPNPEEFNAIANDLESRVRAAQKKVDTLKELGITDNYLKQAEEDLTLAQKERDQRIGGTQKNISNRTHTWEQGYGLRPIEKPQIPEGAKIKMEFKTTTGEKISHEMDAREAEGIFTKEKSSYRALLDCLGR